MVRGDNVWYRKVGLEIIRRRIVVWDRFLLCVWYRLWRRVVRVMTEMNTFDRQYLVHRGTSGCTPTVDLNYLRKRGIDGLPLLIAIGRTRVWCTIRTIIFTMVSRRYKLTVWSLWKYTRVAIHKLSKLISNTTSPNRKHRARTGLLIWKRIAPSFWPRRRN